MIFHSLIKPKTLALLFSILLALPAWAKISAQSEEPSIDTIKEAYNHFLFSEVVSLAAQALQTDPPPPPEEQVEIYTYLAFAHIALGMNDEAKEDFRSALDLDPRITLDPIFVSPKIIAIFDEVKSTVPTGKETKPLEPVPLTFEQDKRLGAAWRSLVLPGWGQLYKGHKKKAVTIFAVTAISVSTLVYAQYKMEQSHDEYLRTSDPENIESTYDRYNSQYKLRNYVLLLTAGIWIYSHIDAALTSSNIEEKSEADEDVRLFMPAVTADSFYLTFCFRF